MSVFFSENPENDLWRELLQFSYEENIKRFLSKRDLPTDVATINCITGSFLQAYEYYKSAQTADIQIAPLLLYYGSTNLLYGMINLLSGEKKRIDNHGMKLLIPAQMDYIADTAIRFLSPQNGGIHVFSRAIHFEKDLTQYGDWSLRDFLDSIAEINTDYIRCYNIGTGRIAFLDTVDTPDGRVEKIYYDRDNKDELKTLLNDVEGFSSSYLRLASSTEFETRKEYYILRHKINGNSICQVSFSGQPYLMAGHRRSGAIITVPTILNYYISLFALASLCRYYPEHWSPFVLNDTTGEKLLVEKFLFYARRMIPNHVLSIIFEEPILYSSSRYSGTNTIKLVGEHQVQEMVARQVKLELENSRILRNIKE